MDLVKWKRKTAREIAMHKSTEAKKQFAQSVKEEALSLKRVAKENDRQDKLHKLSKTQEIKIHHFICKQINEDRVFRATQKLGQNFDQERDQEISFEGFAVKKFGTLKRLGLEQCERLRITELMRRSVEQKYRVFKELNPQVSNAFRHRASVQLSSGEIIEEEVARTGLTSAAETKKPSSKQVSINSRNFLISGKSRTELVNSNPNKRIARRNYPILVEEPPISPNRNPPSSSSRSDTEIIRETDNPRSFLKMSTIKKEVYESLHKEKDFSESSLERLGWFDDDKNYHLQVLSSKYKVDYSMRQNVRLNDLPQSRPRGYT